MNFKYALRLSYSGTRYCGWQRQSKEHSGNQQSIQEVIEGVLRQITQEEVHIVASGRTDAGVHALGQVGHFVVKRKEWDPDKLKKGLNSLLPGSIQVRDLKPAPMEFHAQRSALKKQYSYYFQQGPCALPHMKPYSWWIRKPLDREAMKEALTALIGEHDFKPFQASGAKPGPTVRTIFEAELTHERIRFPSHADSLSEFQVIRARVVGSGFLKQMVRGIAGTLLQVGEGRKPSSVMKEVLETQNRALLGATAAPRGLWLEEVWYPDWDWV